MIDFSRLVPEHIRSLSGYTAGKSIRQAQRESQVTCIKMASNENPFGPSPKAVAAMQACISESNLYPDNDSQALREKLAEVHGVAAEQIVVGGGSTSLIDIIARVLLGPGLNAVTSKQSFIVYPIATQAAGGKLIEVPTRADGYDLDALATAIDANTRVVFLANPNNPTGTLASVEDVDRFVERVPENVVIVLDEAYSDFAQYFAQRRGVEYSHSLDYVRQGRNVVVLRTFSKAQGLAGVRVGYGIGPVQLITYFARMRTTFSVSLPAQAAALAAIEDEAHTRRGLENNAEQSEELKRGIAELGDHVVPTWANFLYCELGEDSAAVAKRLQAEGVIIRPLASWGCPTAIRVTIGTPEQNHAFLRAFRKVMQPAHV